MAIANRLIVDVIEGLILGNRTAIKAINRGKVYIGSMINKFDTAKGYSVIGHNN
jgi:hypothetical protein